MPELPEVETMRRGILPIVGRRIAEVERTPCRRKPLTISPRIDSFRRRAVGQRIEEVGRVGKRVVVRLAGGERIVFEPRMTGLVLVAQPPSVEHLRFRMAIQGGPIRQVLYWDRRGLGSVRLLTTEEFERECGAEKFGPDALVISASELRLRLGHSERAIKVALLDQTAVAGIGNLYASEMLYLSRIHPARGCRQLTIEQWERLHAAMRTILETAIKFEGSTLSDGTYRNALNETGGYQNHHRVYDRAETPCPSCASPIVRIVQAQRSTFYCPRCQPKR